VEKFQAKATNRKLQPKDGVAIFSHYIRLRLPLVSKKSRMRRTRIRRCQKCTDGRKNVPRTWPHPNM